MNKDGFLGLVESTFQKVSPQVDSSHALRWLSHPTITDSGNVKVTIHTKDSKQLDTVIEETITAWAKILQDEVEQSNRLFEVLVPNFPVEPVNLEDPAHKAETIERLVTTIAATISSLTKPDDIRDIQLAEANGQTSWAIAIVIVFNVCELANNVIDDGLDWNGEHYRCEAQGASKPLEQCERCQLHTHTANCFTNTIDVVNPMSLILQKFASARTSHAQCAPGHTPLTAKPVQRGMLQERKSKRFGLRLILRRIIHGSSSLA